MRRRTIKLSFVAPPFERRGTASKQLYPYNFDLNFLLSTIPTLETIFTKATNQKVVPLSSKRGKTTINFIVLGCIFAPLYFTFLVPPTTIAFSNGPPPYFVFDKTGMIKIATLLVNC